MIPWENYDTTFESQFDDLLAELRHLKMEMHSGDRRREMSGFYSISEPHWAVFLAKAMMLQTLHLAFDYVPTSGSPILLSPFSSKREHWPSLRDLKLSGVCCTDEFLRNLLFTHVSTLKELELSDFKIVYEWPLPSLEDNAMTLPSWVELIKFLAQSLRLRYVRLDGRLVAPEELWITHDEDFFRIEYGDDPSYSAQRPASDSLRKRVEDYILRGGNCPIDRPSPSELEDYGDWSWKHSTQRFACDGR